MTDGAAVSVFLIGCLVDSLGVSTRGHEDPGISLPAGAVSGRGGEFVGHTQELSIIVPRLLPTDRLPRDLNSGWGIKLAKFVVRTGLLGASSLSGDLDCSPGRGAFTVLLAGTSQIFSVYLEIMKRKRIFTEM